MIDISYINNSNGYFNDVYIESVINCIDDIGKQIKADFDHIRTIEEKVKIEKMIMNPYFEKKQGNSNTPTQSPTVDAANKEKTNIFAKIGGGIIKVFNTLIDMIHKFIDWMKSFSFRRKSDEEKCKELMKRHPECKQEQLNLMISKGQLNFNAMRYLSDLDNQYDKAVQALKRGEKPDGVMNKFRKATKIVFGEDTSISGVAKSAGAILTFATALATLNGLLASNKSTMAKASTDVEKRRDDVYKMFRAANPDVALVNNDAAFSKIISLLSAEYTKNYAKAVGIMQKNIATLDKEICSQCVAMEQRYRENQEQNRKS